MDTTRSNEPSVAFIGAGAMGAAMIGGLAGGDDIDRAHMVASDRNEDRLALVRDQFGVRTTLCNREAAREADVVVLAVKPQVLPAVLSELQSGIRQDALTLSIVAGASIGTIASLLKHRAIVRTMPNTPAQVGEGMTVWTATPEVSPEQRAQAGTIVGSLGRQLFVDDERFLDIATAISGTGPAYVFLMMEALIDAAVHLGFSRRDARELVVQTIRGAAIYAEHQPVHPAELRNRVTSPGGTTAEALYQLEKGSFRTIMSKAVVAAFRRSVALGEMSTSS
ncbi:MAG: pyrroline-5-carboxylate reductase [Gammaproteobacteria bacterium]|nr:pyrroline-5-carboxylate reductase [Gammaproteobacteria bacterium]MYC50684.1 pyrroline-5-carboxylate reductase [Gammaproteobacteria bacterium]